MSAQPANCRTPRVAVRTFDCRSSKVFISRSIQIDLSLCNKRHQHRGREWFCERGEAKGRPRGYPNALLAISEPKALLPNETTLVNHSDGNPGGFTACNFLENSLSGRSKTILTALF